MDEQQNSGTNDSADDASGTEVAVGVTSPQPTTADDLFAPAMLNDTERGALLVAVLYSAGDVVDAARLAEYLEIDPGDLAVLVAEIAGALRPLGMDILAAAGGYRLVTAAQWDSYLRNFHRRVRKSRITKNALEILAVVAYEQPVTRTRIDELRQVNSESTVRSLLDKRMITVAGRADKPGRPFLYRTTERFLEMFGLGTLMDLPPRPPSLEKAKSIELGVSTDDSPAGLDELPGFDIDQLADELED